MVGFGRADIQDSGAAVDGRSKIKGYFDILLNGYYGASTLARRLWLRVGKRDDDFRVTFTTSSGMHATPAD